MAIFVIINNIIRFIVFPIKFLINTSLAYLLIYTTSLKIPWLRGSADSNPYIRNPQYLTVLRLFIGVKVEIDDVKECLITLVRAFYNVSSGKTPERMWCIVRIHKFNSLKLRG